MQGAGVRGDVGSNDARSTGGRFRRALIAVGIAAVVLAGASAASGAGGGFGFRGCITGDSNAGPVSGGGSGACKATPHASSFGSHSGLGAPLTLAVTADGKSVYAASSDDDAIARFKRSKATGALTYKNCITGDTAAGPVSGGGSGACKAIPHATSGGALSGLDRPRAVTVSADGKSVYVSAGPFGGDDAIARFKRSKATGALKYKGCVTGNTQAGPASGGGSGACKAIPPATAGGAASGLDQPRTMAVSRDGRSLYVLSRTDDAVTRFKRSRATGALAFKSCITGDIAAGPVSGGGSGACKALPHASASGADSGLDSPESLVASGDGKSLYAVSASDSAVDRFKRSKATGALAFKNCITGETSSGPVGGGGSGACKAAPHIASFAQASGLNSLHSVTLTSDGRSLYTAASGDDAIARFKRSRKTGALAFKNCISGNTAAGPVSGGGSGACKLTPHAQPDGVNSGFNNLDAVVAKASGRAVYTASAFDDGIARFKRSRATGALAFRSCITGDTATGPVSGGGSGACKTIPHASSFGTDSGVNEPTWLSLSADDRSLYVAAPGDDSVARIKP
jgi:6-phosphogluconolactonase (cycloisomerase 2 family)